MEKKGAMELSFGMIFSILMIIAIVSVASYAIVYFVNLGSLSEMALFHQKFQETVDEVWGTSITDKVYRFSLPKGIEYVCFGDLTTQNWNPLYEEVYNDLIQYSSNFEQANTNRFIYPRNKAGDFDFLKVEKIDLTELGTDFECFEVRDRKIEVKMVKDQNDALVKLKKIG
jgi:hypothetical protein